jgi:hypothetical protein
MYIGSNDAFLEAQFADKVRVGFAPLKLENGAPGGDVLAAALLLDRRRAEVPAERLLELTNNQMIDAYCDLTWLLFDAKAGGQVTLPFGTEATSERRGGLKIGPCHYMLDASKPGLHAMESVRRDAHGPNLDLLQTLIRRKTRRLACRRLGVPHPAGIFDNMPRHLLQFPPCDDAGGVVLQREAYGTGAERFCAATHDQIDEFAESIVSDMRQLWSARRAVAERVEIIRSAAMAAVADADPAAPYTLKTIAVDLSADDGKTAPCLYVEFNGLDEALRPGVVLDYAPGRSDGWSPRVDFTQRYRREDADKLRALGADGWIEPVAASVAALAPGGAVAAFAPLATDQEVYIVIPTARGTMHATLFWREGTIKAEVDLPGVFSCWGDTVEITKAGLPETVITALEGRPMSDVLPAPLASAGLITDASPLNNSGMRLRFEKPEDQALRVNLSTGKVW